MSRVFLTHVSVLNCGLIGFFHVVHARCSRKRTQYVDLSVVLIPVAADAYPAPLTAHLIMMPVTPISTVIEIFYPEGFAHDYEWTARARGMKHFAVWNDTFATYPDPRVANPAYPEGFQGTQIPVHGPTVARLLEERYDGVW